MGGCLPVSLPRRRPEQRRHRERRGFVASWQLLQPKPPGGLAPGRGHELQRWCRYRRPPIRPGQLWADGAVTESVNSAARGLAPACRCLSPFLPLNPPLFSRGGLSSRSVHHAQSGLACKKVVLLSAVTLSWKIPPTPLCQRARLIPTRRDRQLQGFMRAVVIIDLPPLILPVVVATLIAVILLVA